jgi:membrane protein
MTQADRPRERQSIVGLARQLLSGMVQLGRLEIARGRQEIGEMVGQAKAGVILLGIAVALVLLALIAFVMFIILGVAALLSFLPDWLVALLFFVLLMLIAALLAWRGIKKIRIGPPEETIEAIKEDIAWAKRLLRRD